MAVRISRVIDRVTDKAGGLTLADQIIDYPGDVFRVRTLSDRGSAADHRGAC